MPFRIETSEHRALEQSGALLHGPDSPPRLRVILTPYKSLTPEGFVWFIGVTASLIVLPLLSLLGTSVFWALLPFVLAALWGIWAALKRSWRDMDLYEDVSIWDDLLRVERHAPKGGVQTWEANPHWVRFKIHPKTGPVPQYLTLTGSKDGREIELGAFLTAAERLRLRDMLEQQCRDL